MKPTREWSMKAGWRARWLTHPTWHSAELVTPYGYGACLLYSISSQPLKYCLRASFIWEGLEHQMRIQNAKPFTRIQAVRIVNRWIREKVGEKS